ncbi:hypothetical protein [Luteolibacter soli]|uniref:Uncharacterized protein n=1 Tax=Luteolibacter soli TaxID=3135280 RepID=A0ABU9AWL4_9BACT
MKTGALALALALILGLLLLPAHAAEPERSAEEKFIIASLEKLPARMKLKFDIPFPKDWDTDEHSKQPIAIMEIDGAKVCITQPKMQPYDGHGTIEWMIGPEDPKRLIQENVQCFLHLDDSGEFFQIGLLVSNDPWTAEDRVDHQLRRRDDETGPAFFERALLTYRLRAKKAKDPVFAARVLTTVEKISTIVQQLRKEEAAHK